MYYMDHLLTLLTTEKGRELQFRAGSPPVIVLEDEQHSLQGPPITREDVMRLLRSMATSRQMRDLRDHGTVQFIYTLPEGHLFWFEPRWRAKTLCLMFRKKWPNEQ